MDSYHVHEAVEASPASITSASILRAALWQASRRRSLRGEED